ncbi:MAG: isoleucine--tRNA ligase, partial [Bacteroidales bacterium]|nr:isoleucine--tRNA ligase [Bacteroidales bacterium]
IQNGKPNAFRVISGDFVTTEDGTGIVHIAPTFGADDDRVAKQNGIAPMLLLDKTGKQVPMVDLTGKFYTIEDLDNNFVTTNINVQLYEQYAGKFVKDAYYTNLPEKHLSLDDELCIRLKEMGLLFKSEKHTHNYPHCWRTDKPVLYYPLDSWFIKSTACREQMIALNNTINWKPQSTGTGRFGKWLENLNDWNLSRSRYWGTPLPIWRSEDGSEEMCIGSIEELMNEIEKSISAGFMTENPFKNFKVGDFSEENYSTANIDLHRPFVDNITLVSTTGKPMKRELDLIDVWFDSGAMPYAQVHYPFENAAQIDGGAEFPADFISEGVDQTRGWFFTLHAISTMIKGSVAFKNVISNGLVLDKNGNKMSKRLGNAVDPFETIEKYGSDPLRWYMITNASPWENLKYDNEGIEELKRKFFGTLYNTYSFFALYANLDNFDPTTEQVPFDERPELDRWILSLLHTLIQEVTEHYENYEPTKAGRAIQEFVMDNVSNWYVRLSRKRFWKGKLNADKLSAYQTLQTCLKVVAQLMAPIAPFYAEQLYADVTKTNVSVHLQNFPQADSALIDKKLETQMHLAQTISSMVLALRRKVAIKVRQPLQKIIIPIVNEDFAEDVQKIAEIVKSEVNVKEIELLSDASGILVKKVKANFKALGPRYGKIMKQIAAHLSEMENATIFALEKSGSYSFDIEGTTVEIGLPDVEIISEDIPGWQVANEGNITVAIDTTITPELLHEGIAREFVNRIQNLRKESGFDVTDIIDLYVQKHNFVNEAIEKYKNYIASETLCTSVTVVESVTVAHKKMIEIEDVQLEIGIQKSVHNR